MAQGAGDGLVVKSYQLDARGGAGMSDREDLSQSRFGQFRLLQNMELRKDTWDRRDGWAKVNTTAMGWDRALFMDSYVDTQKARHILVVGDDGNLYHDTDWTTPVVIHGAVVWDGTYACNGCAFGDDYYICFSGADGSARSLRYDGINGVAWTVGLPGPTATVLGLADAGAGNIPGGGATSYRVTYYWVEEAWESGPTPIATIVLAANRQVNITGIPVFGGWTGVGRTIYRYIYRLDFGGAWYRLATIADNTTVAYNDNLAATTNVSFIHYHQVDAFHCVALNRSGILTWGYEPTENTPASIYTAVDHLHPEQLRVDSDTQPIVVEAGGDDDPLVALYGMRDGVFAIKGKSVYLYSALCEDCEGIHEGIGTVSWASVVNVGSVPWWLSDSGPVGIDHSIMEQFRYAGPDGMFFALRELWDSVDTSFLRFSWGIHASCQGRKCIMWGVRRCTTGDHNDTIIVWDYANRTDMYPYGKLHLWTMLCDFACRVKVDGREEDEIWGAFPGGFVGKFFDGQHGDGCEDFLTLTPVTVNGTVIGIDPADLPAWALEGSGLKGVSVFVYGGTGEPYGVDIPVCYPSQALITEHTTDSALGHHITTSADLGLDTTSVLWLGGFCWEGRLRHDAEMPGIQKQWVMLQLKTKGTI